MNIDKKPAKNKKSMENKEDNIIHNKMLERLEKIDALGDEDADIVSLAKLHPRYQRFIHLYITGNFTLTKLSEILGVNPKTLTTWLNKPNVQQAILDMQKINHHVIANQIQAVSNKAIAKMSSLIDSDDEKIAISASKDILDRAGYKPTQQIKVDKTVRTFEEKINSLINETLPDTDYEEVD